MGKSASVVVISAIIVLAVRGMASGEGKIISPEVPSYVLPLPRVSPLEPDPMGSRLFKTTTRRRQVTLAGNWDFVTDPKNKGLAEGYYKAFPQPETRMVVPGTWNVVPRYYQYLGPAWYRRRFRLNREGNLHLHFGGIFLSARVWLDGVELGRHEGGYTPVDFYLAGVKAGEHELVVRADNRMGDETLPKWGADWFPYGGIVRPAYLEVVPEVMIKRFHVIPGWGGKGPAELLVRVFTRSFAGSAKKLPCEFYIDGSRVYRRKVRVEPGDDIVEFRVTIPAPRPWSPEEPNLYTARLVLGRDDLIDRFGIRSLKADGCRIFLNRNRLKIKGANRHDDHPDWGAALPQAVIRNDVEILKRMNANAFRSHYPPSEMFMDYCDEAGLLYLTEVPSWQYSTRQLSSPVTNKLIRDFLRELITRDMNHPSVFSWSLGNEWPGPEDKYDWKKVDEVYDVVRSLVEYARELDTGHNHFISVVVGGGQYNRCSGLFDVLMVNWAVYPWYGGPDVLDEEVKKKTVKRLEDLHRAFPDKPIVVTEMGGSGSQYGWRNWGNVKWSENFQARNVAGSAEYILKSDYLSGGLVWQYSDSRTHPNRMLAARLRGWNVKGVVDCYRMPKMAYFRLQEVFSRY